MGVKATCDARLRKSTRAAKRRAITQRVSVLPMALDSAWSVKRTGKPGTATNVILPRVGKLLGA